MPTESNYSVGTLIVQFLVIVLLLGVLIMATMVVPESVFSEDVLSAPPSEAAVYTVEPGDSLSAIAVRFNTTVEELLALNPQLGGSQAIQTGQRLAVPGTPFIPQEMVIVPDTGGQPDAVPGVNIITGGPVVQAAPLAGAPGSMITVSGTGFTANSAVNLGLSTNGSASTAITSAPTDANGAFTTQIAIPPGAAVGEALRIIATAPMGGATAASPVIEVTGNLIPAVVSAQSQPVMISVAPSGRTYQVVNGDSLYSIAQTYGTTVDALLSANPSLGGSTVIFPGQVLNIP